MCGDTITEEMQKAWAKYLPAILNLNSTPSTQDTDEDSLKTQYEAIKIIDKKLRPPGTQLPKQLPLSVYTL